MATVSRRRRGYLKLSLSSSGTAGSATPRPRIQSESRQGHRRIRVWYPTSRGRPTRCTLTPDVVAALGRAHGKRRGLITIRWTLWLSLLLVLVFAITVGYHLGAAYMDQLLTR